MLGGTGMTQGRRRKNRPACVIPPPYHLHHPPPLKILRVRAVVGLHMLVCRFYIFPALSPYHPPVPPSPFKILRVRGVVGLHMFVCSFFLFPASSPYTLTHTPPPQYSPHPHTLTPHLHPSRFFPTFG